MFRTSPPHGAAIVFVTALVAALAGCVDNSAELDARAAPNASRIAARPGVSPAGATAAFVSLEGAPADIAVRFAQMTRAEAARREVAVAEPGAAHYLVRGYLSAQTVAGGTALAYVWDVFDKSRRRVQRSEDAIVVNGAAADPWSLADEKALTSLAARSADDLAAILSNMPEAQARGAAPAAIAAAATVVAPRAPAGLRAYR